MVLLILTLMGCSSFAKFLPSNFDNVEFGKLVELNILAITPSTTDWCDKSDIAKMSYVSRQLEVYSFNRLNTNISNIYAGINSLVLELNDKQNPSSAYCKIKRTSIYETTKKTLATFGDRK
jgi:hypothetical protein